MRRDGREEGRKGKRRRKDRENRRGGEKKSNVFSCSSLQFRVSWGPERHGREGYGLCALG